MLATHQVQKVQQHVITEAHASQRVDNFLLNFLRGVPKSRIYRIIRKGEVRVNKRRVDVSYKLVLGDSVRIPPIRMAEKSEVKAAPGVGLQKLLQASICYEDDRLLVVNKPTGIAVHGGSGISMGLIEALRSMRPEAHFLELVHRIDRDTSGCVMIAKKRSMLVHLHDCLLKGNIKKRYVALVKGHWSGGKFVDAPLHRYTLKSGERMVKVDEQGKKSQTSVRVIQSLTNATYLSASPLTGRTHQIRVHCAFKGHSILGDQKYGDLEFNAQLKAQGFDRLFLHAHELVVSLTPDEEPITITADVPDGFKACMEALSSTCRAKARHPELDTSHARGK